MAVIYYTESLPVNVNVAGAASSMSATLAPGSGKTAYVTGFTVSGLGATAASAIGITLGGLIGNTSQMYQYQVPAGATTAAPTLQINFPLPIPGAGANSNITLTVPSFGTGNTASSCAIYGYYK